MSLQTTAHKSEMLDWLTNVEWSDPTNRVQAAFIVSGRAIGVPDDVLYDVLAGLLAP